MNSTASIDNDAFIAKVEEIYGEELAKKFKTELERQNVPEESRIALLSALLQSRERGDVPLVVTPFNFKSIPLRFDPSQMREPA